MDPEIKFVHYMNPEAFGIKEEPIDYDSTDEESVKLISINNIEDNSFPDEPVMTYCRVAQGIEAYRLEAEKENLSKISSLKQKFSQFRINNKTDRELLADYVNIHNQEAYKSFGLYVGKQLSCLPRKVAAICQKLLREIIFEAEMEMLWPFEETQQGSATKERDGNISKHDVNEKECDVHTNQINVNPREENNVVSKISDLCISKNEVNKINEIENPIQDDFDMRELNDAGTSENSCGITQENVSLNNTDVTTGQTENVRKSQATDIHTTNDDTTAQTEYVYKSEATDIYTTNDDTTAHTENFHKSQATDIRTTNDDTTAQIENIYEIKATDIYTTNDTTAQKENFNKSQATDIHTTNDNTTAQIENVYKSKATDIYTTNDDTTAQTENFHKSQATDIHTTYDDTTVQIENVYKCQATDIHTTNDDITAQTENLHKIQATDIHTTNDDITAPTENLHKIQATDIHTTNDDITAQIENLHKIQATDIHTTNDDITAPTENVHTIQAADVPTSPIENVCDSQAATNYTKQTHNFEADQIGNVHKSRIDINTGITEIGFKDSQTDDITEKKENVHKSYDGEVSAIKADSVNTMQRYSTRKRRKTMLDVHRIDYISQREKNNGNKRQKKYHNTSKKDGSSVNQTTIKCKEEPDVGKLQFPETQELPPSNRNDCTNNIRVKAGYFLNLGCWKKCPFCEKKIKFLSKHIANVHETGGGGANFRINKNINRCPIAGCVNKKPILRLDVHLRRKHGLQESDAIYKKLMNCNSATAVYKNSIKLDYAQISCQQFVKEQENLFMRYNMEVGSSLKLVKQRAMKLRQILVGMKVSSMKDIAGEAGAQTFKNWMDAYIESNKTSNLTIYLYIYNSYIKQVMLTDFGKRNEQYLNDIIVQLNKWKQIYSKCRLTQVKGANPQMISKTEISLFEESQIYKDTLAAIHKLATDELQEVTVLVHSDTRNFIMLLILIHTNCNAQVLSNMTLNDFYSAVNVLNEAILFRVISIQCHTYRDRSSEEIVIPARIYALLNSYIENVRIKFASKNATAVFITSQSGHLTCDHISKSINTIWKKAGFVTKIGCKMFRKTRDLLVNPNHLVDSGIVNFYGTKTAPKCVNSATVDIPLVANENEDVLPALVVESKSHSTNGIASAPLRDNEQVSNSNQRKSKGRPFFTASERITIKKAFIRFISQNVMPTISEIRTEVDFNEKLVSLLKSKQCTEHKFKGAIQNFINVNVKKLKQT